jgi:hypothetical protein
VPPARAPDEGNATAPARACETPPVTTFRCKLPCIAPGLVNAEMTGQHLLRRRLPSRVGPNAAQAPP